MVARVVIGTMLEGDRRTGRGAGAGAAGAEERVRGGGGGESAWVTNDNAGEMGAGQARVGESRGLAGLGGFGGASMAERGQCCERALNVARDSSGLGRRSVGRWR